MTTDALFQARSLVNQLVACGIQNVVLSPGSRNAPLAIAFSENESITLHVNIDERSAGFFAVGLAKATLKMVAVVCTSGTAAANYYPAILEAHHSDTPLLVITADRPEELHGKGSNQTTNQQYMYGDAASSFIHIPAGRDVSWQRNLVNVLGDQRGPVHVNIAFREPLISNEPPEHAPTISNSSTTKLSALTSLTEIGITSKTVVVIGHDIGNLDTKELHQWLGKTGFPVIAENPLSFTGALPHASLWVDTPKVLDSLKPESVITIGRYGLSRSVMSLLKTIPNLVAIDTHREVCDPLDKAALTFSTLPTPDVSAEEIWVKDWHKYAELALSVVKEFESSWSEPALAKKISEMLKSKDALFVGSSRPVRDIEAFAIPRGDIRVFANRGLAGIDGNIATANGIASGISQHLYAYMGDLTFLHDVSSLLLYSENLTLVVVNNDGGGIFSTLPQRGVKDFEKIFGTPQHQDLAAIATAFGHSVESVSNFLEFESAMSSKPKVIVCNMPDRESNADVLNVVKQRITQVLPN